MHIYIYIIYTIHYTLLYYIHLLLYASVILPTIIYYYYYYIPIYIYIYIYSYIYLLLMYQQHVTEAA